MKSFSVSILSFSLRSLVKNRLHRAVSLIGRSIHNQYSNPTQQLESALSLPAIIPLNQVRATARVAYQSAIALKLANQWRLTVIELAEQIAIGCTSLNSLDQEDHNLPLERIYQHFVFHVTASGWIDIELTDAGIALWLQTLVRYGSCLNWAEQRFYQGVEQTSSVDCKHDSNFFQNTISLFEIQYTHARCCTKLGLGVEAGLITLSDFPLVLLYPNPFPWLTINQSLRLQHPDERRLVQQLARVLDDLSKQTAPYLMHEGSSVKPAVSQPPADPASQKKDISIENFDKYQQQHGQQEILKLAQMLSWQVQACHATCQMRDDVERGDLALAQTRLGLTLVTQIILHHLLEKELGVTAPIRL